MICILMRFLSQGTLPYQYGNYLFPAFCLELRFTKAHMKMFFRQF